jgi:hypothetical protein
MVTINNNAPRSLTVRYVGGKGEISLMPGINLSIPQKEWDFIKVHPVVQNWLEAKLIDVLSILPTVEGELEGFEVSTRKEDDQPIPHLEARIGSGSLKPVVTATKSPPLTDLKEVTVKEAEEVIRFSNDKDGLLSLKGIDSRKTVQTAITERLSELENNG